MSKISYPPLIEKISRNVKVIWRGNMIDRNEDPWRRLRKEIIDAGSKIDVEELLDMKGFLDAEKHL